MKQKIIPPPGGAILVVKKCYFYTLATKMAPPGGEV